MFGHRLRELRNEKGLRQEDVGKIAGVVKSAVSQWESCERTPDPATLERLADFFKVSVDYLLGRTDRRQLEPTPFEIEAAHRQDDPMADLPPEARKSLEEFKEYILKKYSKK